MIKKFSIHDDYVGFYAQHGYAVLTDLVPVGQLLECRERVIGLFRNRLKSMNSDLQADYLFANTYKTSKEVWRQAARRMWDLPILASIASKANLLDVTQRLGLEEPIFSTRPEVRTDMPGDLDYRQPWYQDWKYGQPSINGVTFWIPLQDVHEAN